MRTLTAGIAMAMSWMCVGLCFSQESDTDCNAVLVKDVMTHTQDETSILDVLNIISEDVWEVLHTQGGANASYGPIKLGGSYNQFKSNRDQYFSQNNYHKSESQALTDTQIKTSEQAIKEWGKCVEAKMGPGFRMWPEHSDDATVTVAFKYGAPPTDLRKIKVGYSHLVGATTTESGALADEGFPKGTPFGPGEKKTRTFNRVSGTPFTISVDIGGYSRSIALPPVYKTPSQVQMRKAIDDDDIPTLQGFIQSGFDINWATDNEGNTPLYRAIERGHKTMVEWLLNNGADPKIKNTHTDNGYDIAAEMVHRTKDVPNSSAPDILKVLTSRQW